MPLPTAQKLMGKLACAGLLTSVRGAGGGFTLARPVTEISLADIVEAVEGPIAMTMCADGDESSTARSTPIAGSSRTWAIVGAKVRGALHAVIASGIGAMNEESLTQPRSARGDRQGI